MKIECNVKNQILSVTNSNTLANFSENYLVLGFDFETEDWNDLTKFALFFTDDRVTRVASINDEVIVPADLLEYDRLTFSIYGVTDIGDGIRITTNKVSLFLNDSGYTNKAYDEGGEKLTADVVETIYLAINNHTHVLSRITDLSTVEMEVTYPDSTTETFDMVIKNEES